MGQEQHLEESQVSCLLVKQNTACLLKCLVLTGLKNVPVDQMLLAYEMAQMRETALIKVVPR